MEPIYSEHTNEDTIIRTLRDRVDYLTKVKDENLLLE